MKAIVQEWTLMLKGKLTEEMDRATFESGSAEGCHGQEWTDAEGNMWTGIPLYLLVGRVDDDIAHEGPAYNRDLAEAGYRSVSRPPTDRASRSPARPCTTTRTSSSRTS